MTLSELINQTIDRADLAGRSFTYGVALYTLLQQNQLTGSAVNETIDDVLVQHVAGLLDISTDTVAQHFSLGALIEVTDISILDELANELAEEEL